MMENNSCFLSKRSIEEIFIMDKLIDSYFKSNTRFSEEDMSLTYEERKNFLMSFIKIMNIDLTNDLFYELDKLNCEILHTCELEVEDYKNFEKILPINYNIFDFSNVIDVFSRNFYARLRDIIRCSIKYLKCDDRCEYFNKNDYSILDLCVASVTDEIDFSFKFPKSYKFVCKNEYIKKKFEYYELLIFEKNDEDLLSYLTKISSRYDSKNKKSAYMNVL